MADAVGACEAGAKGGTAIPQGKRYTKKGGTGRDGEPRATRLQRRGPLGGDTSGGKGHGEGKGPGVGRLVRWGKDGVRGTVAGNAPAQWILVPMAMGDHRRQPLYSAFSASIGHPPLRKRPILDASRTLLPMGARKLWTWASSRGQTGIPTPPEAPSSPGKRGRAGRPPRPRPCPFEGRCLRPERAKQSGSAAASRGPRHPPIGGATE